MKTKLWFIAIAVISLIAIISVVVEIKNNFFKTTEQQAPVVSVQQSGKAYVHKNIVAVRIQKKYCLKRNKLIA